MARAPARREVDLLVNNAGWDKVAAVRGQLSARPGTAHRVNLRAPVQLTHAFLPGMLERGWRRLLFLSSDAARVGSTGEAVYAGCKAGLIGFAKTVARESGAHRRHEQRGVPWPVGHADAAEIAGDNPKLVEALQRAIPLGRLGQPSDVAGMVAFLCRSGRPTSPGRLQRERRPHDGVSGTVLRLRRRARGGPRPAAGSPGVPSSNQKPRASR